MRIWGVGQARIAISALTMQLRFCPEGASGCSRGMSEAIPPVNIVDNNFPEGDAAATVFKEEFTALLNAITSITAPGQFGNRLGGWLGWNRRIPFGEVSMGGCRPGESLRSSPGYMPQPLRGRISRTLSGLCFGKPHKRQDHFRPSPDPLMCARKSRYSNRSSSRFWVVGADHVRFIDESTKEASDMI